ncbi:MAG TPA: pyridoxal-dependent decarboxylase [Kineosporiaceae bacterium]|nr:pyridoxal-dependent decarboxylase [Kineosporiaceae bacterium]
MTPEEFRAAGHVLIDWIADHRTRIADLPVQAQVRPGEVAAALPSTPPAGTEDITALIADLERVIVPGLTQVQHPRHVGWFPSNAALASVLGDLASSGLGGLGISWQSAPALTELEQVVCDWMRQLTGLSPSWQGAIHDTASTACLVALLAARERAGGYSVEHGGLQSLPQPLVVYASEQAHSSVPKAVLLAGFGRDNLRLIQTDPQTHAMLPDALAAAMAADVAAGRRPAAVVVSIGTTATTAVDPLATLLPIAGQHGAWVHVDAAMAGSALLLPEYRWLIDGIDGDGAGSPAADSLSWNPHKWMGTVLDCSLLYVRDPELLIRVMSTAPSYLRSTADAVVEYRDWGIPLGRRFRALKLWFHLRLDGVPAIQARLRRDLLNARRLADAVAAEPGWRVLAPVQLQTVCLRHEPPGLVAADGAVLDGEALDRHTLAWADALNASGAGFVSPAVLDGRWMVRISIGVESTEWDDVEAVWTAARAEAARASAVL